VVGCRLAASSTVLAEPLTFELQPPGTSTPSVLTRFPLPHYGRRGRALRPGEELEYTLSSVDSPDELRGASLRVLEHAAWDLAHFPLPDAFQECPIEVLGKPVNDLYEAKRVPNAEARFWGDTERTDRWAKCLLTYRNHLPYRVEVLLKVHFESPRGGYALQRETLMPGEATSPIWFWLSDPSDKSKQVNRFEVVDWCAYYESGQDRAAEHLVRAWEAIDPHAELPSSRRVRGQLTTFNRGLLGLYAVEMECNGGGHSRFTPKNFPLDRIGERAKSLLGAARWATSLVDIKSPLERARILDQDDRLIVSTPGRELLPDSGFDTFLIEEGRIVGSSSWNHAVSGYESWTKWLTEERSGGSRLVGLDQPAHAGELGRVEIAWELRGEHEWPTRVTSTPPARGTESRLYTRESILWLGTWATVSAAGDEAAKAAVVTPPDALVKAWDALARPGPSALGGWKGDVDVSIVGPATRGWFDQKSLGFDLSFQRTGPCATTIGAGLQSGKLKYPERDDATERFLELLRCWATLDPTELRPFREEFPTIERVDSDGTTHVGHPLVEHLRLDPKGRLVIGHREFGQVVCVLRRGVSRSIDSISYGSSRIELGKRAPSNGPAVPSEIRFFAKQTDHKASVTLELSRWKSPER